MRVPEKAAWKVTASSGDPRLAVDDLYATTWIAAPSGRPWFEIDLGAATTLGGLEVYWGNAWATILSFESSLDGTGWTRLCGTGHGEGGQDVFAFPPAEARFVRLACQDDASERGLEIVEINLYAPAEAATVLEDSRIAVLGHGPPITLAAGGAVTVDLGYMRSPLGAFIEWGETYGTDFSMHLSDDGQNFRDVGRITPGNGGSDSFWWRSTKSRYIRLTIHAASAPAGAVVNELKLRILNKDRMPIGQLERAAAAGPGDLYPQALLGRQVYWTALGEFDQGEQALFDEYGDLEPCRGFPQLTPLIRLEGALHGAPASADIEHSLVDGSLPIPSVIWSAAGLELRATALAHKGQAIVEYRVTNRSRTHRKGAIVLAVRPVQINPYWQHGGHASIRAIAVAGRGVRVNDRMYAAFSRKPDALAVAEFDGGDVVKLIGKGPQRTARSLRSDSGLLSAACEFAFALPPGGETYLVVSSPMRDGVRLRAANFSSIRDSVAKVWRKKLGPRKITVGDPEVSDTVEAQTALILVNATRSAFRPGPRNYDRVWIRDGSSQALALLWAGLIEEAEAYVLWYAKRIEPNGLAPPILNVDGTINRGYGSNIEFDAQGEFVGIAADVYRISRDRDFVRAVFEPVVRATRFIEQLCAETDAAHGPGTRFYGLLAPSISHEGYSKPSYSYWDDYFALSAWRNCEWLAREIEETDIAAHAAAKGREFAANLTRSIRMTAAAMGRDQIPGSADRDDVDPHATAIAFEPCRVEDVLPAELLPATFDIVAKLIATVGSPDFGNYTPYVLRDINALVSLGRFQDAFGLLSAGLRDRRPCGWRGWAEVVWSDPRAPEYIGDMPHTWIGAEFATAIRRMLLRENGGTLELFRAVPDAWWEGDGITLRDLPTSFGIADLSARREQSQATIDLALTGPAPDRITVRYPGAKQANADGAPCQIHDGVVFAPNLKRLIIDF